MQEPRTDPVWLDDIEPPQAARASKRVCIISGDPLRPRAFMSFMAALDPALRGNEELTIIVDRRRPSSESAAERPPVERRRHPSVDAKVKTDGFAVVPQSTDDPPWIERLFPRQSPDDDADASERAIQRILEFKRRHNRRVGQRLGPVLGVSAVVGVLIVLVALFVQMPVGKAPVTPERTAEPPTQVQAVAVQSPSLAATPLPPPRTSPAPPPADRVGKPRNAVRAPKDAVAPMSEPLDTRPIPAADVTPPPHPRTAPPPEPAGPPASAPEPTPDSDSAPNSQTGAIPADTPARPGSAPRQPTAKGTLKELENLVSRDVNAAGEEAKRQAGELKAKSLEKLDEMRRVWNNARQMFSGPFKDPHNASDEAAAGLRR